jgi:hypothetical protein
MARSRLLAVRGASGMVTIFPPYRTVQKDRTGPAPKITLGSLSRCISNLAGDCGGRRHRALLGRLRH